MEKSLSAQWEEYASEKLGKIDPQKLLHPWNRAGVTQLKDLKIFTGVFANIRIKLRLWNDGGLSIATEDHGGSGRFQRRLKIRPGNYGDLTITRWFGGEPPPAQHVIPANLSLTYAPHGHLDSGRLCIISASSETDRTEDVELPNRLLQPQEAVVSCGLCRNNTTLFDTAVRTINTGSICICDGDMSKLKLTNKDPARTMKVPDQFHMELTPERIRSIVNAHVCIALGQAHLPEPTRI